MEKLIRVLIVDDNRDLADLLAGALDSREGIRVVGVCYSGYQAIRMVQAKEIDVVLLDVILPELSGFQVLAQIRELGPNPPAVILITALGSGLVMKNPQALGAARVLTKPVPLQVLLNSIRGACADRP